MLFNLSLGMPPPPQTTTCTVYVGLDESLCMCSFDWNGFWNGSFLLWDLRFIVGTFRKTIPEAFSSSMAAMSNSFRIKNLQLVKDGQKSHTCFVQQAIKLIYAPWKSVRNVYFTAHFTFSEIIIIWHGLPFSFFLILQIQSGRSASDPKKSQLICNREQ